VVLVEDLEDLIKVGIVVFRLFVCIVVSFYTNIKVIIIYIHIYRKPFLITPGDKKLSNRKKAVI
jgi:hypothetical protein